MRPITTGAGAGGGHQLMDKQSLVPVVQELWNAWEIHSMILLSLSLQVFLFLFAGLRRRSSNWFLRTVLWLAYLSADNVAVFVLGHLAVRAREPGHELMAFWAPFVLVHLGGQDTITAFSKQDNELWRRHLLNLVLQAAVAGYVVTKASWPDARFRKAMVLIFISGFFKYAERTGCLGYSATENLKLMNKRMLMFALKSKNKAKENLRRGPKATLARMKKGSSALRADRLFFEAYAIIKELIAMDVPLNKEQNMAAAAHGDELPVMLKGFLSSKSRHSAYEYVGAVLKDCYRWLYTKESARYQGLCILSHPFSTTITTSIALALFRAAVDKEADQLHTSSSSRVDITVTYVLLVGALALDVCSAAIVVFRHLSFFCLACLPSCMKRQPRQWSQEIQQYNIIRIAGMSCIWHWLFCDVYSKPLENEHTSIKKFILDTLLASGTRKEWRIASTRGQLALQKWHERHQSTHFATTTTLKSLKETIASSTDFPTSVLVLHIATDICYHSDHGEVVKNHKQTSTELSNYIMYLVFQRGVMLTINSKIAHDNARDEISNKLRLQRKKIYEVSKHRRDLLPSRFSIYKRKICNVFKRCEDLGNDKGKAAVISLFEAVKEQRQAFSMGEINIRHQESAEQQDSTNEIEGQESTDTDDNNAADDDHIKKLQMNSKTLQSPVLPRAVAVAQELIAIENEAERWELIAKVWAEMLYYIAPRCGGDFHYDHLSKGGEFATHVLLLMYYVGPFMPPPS